MKRKFYSSLVIVIAGLLFQEWGPNYFLKFRKIRLTIVYFTSCAQVILRYEQFQSFFIKSISHGTLGNLYISGFTESLTFLAFIQGDANPVNWQLYIDVINAEP